MFYLACPGYPDCAFTMPLVVEMPGRCPKCGCEVPVDLAEILSDGVSDLFGTAVCCAECSKEARNGQ
jgi:ssDNA-binding Zn-finger/Zn-ribbon topoisomerase 1